MTALARVHVGRRRLRLALLVALALSALLVVRGAATAPRSGTAADVPEAPPREGITVATESARYGTIVAWHPNGSRLYYADEHTKYFDVDPVANTAATVEYTATDTIHTAGPTCRQPPCARNLVERTNLTTGETTVIRARYDDTETAAEWHDHTRLSETEIVVADMVADQVVLVNTTTGLTEWRWDAQNAYPLRSGGGYPGDWTHLNDVESLSDGRIMVSLRNQDQVVFLDPDSGRRTDWTLGTDGNHSRLYEQHNPDFIPAENGGPALLVADSENGRAIEYQRVDGEWEQSWTWQDRRLTWVRDADRLPNGHTLLSDSNGDRVLEIDENAEVVWQTTIGFPYESERLGTGDESTGGPSAASIDLPSQRDSDDGATPAGLLPQSMINAITYLLPGWAGTVEVVSGLGLLVVVPGWTVFEWRRRGFDVRLQWPVELRDR